MKWLVGFWEGSGWRMMMMMPQVWNYPPCDCVVVHSHHGNRMDCPRQYWDCHHHLMMSRFPVLRMFSYFRWNNRNFSPPIVYLAEEPFLWSISKLVTCMIDKKLSWNERKSPCTG